MSGNANKVASIRLVRHCSVCGCSKLFYGSRPKNDSGPADHVLHWKTWEGKGLTPPHEIRRGNQPRYACNGGNKPYIESLPNVKTVATEGAGESPDEAAQPSSQK